MNIMKELLKPKFITNHKDWWGMLTSTFVGSLLGIGVTFGVSAYLENKQQEEVERKMLLVTVSDIDAKCEEFNYEVEDMAALDSTFLVMSIYAADEDLYDYFPKDKRKTYLLERSLINMYECIDVDEDDDDDSWITSTNTELIHIFDDLSTLNSFKNIIATMKEFDMLITGINNLKKEILVYDDKYRLDENADYPGSFMKCQVKYEAEERRKKILTFIYSYQLLQSLNMELQRDWPKVKEKLGITEEDLLAAKSNIFDDYWGAEESVDSLLNCKVISIRAEEMERLKKLKASEQKKEK